MIDALMKPAPMGEAIELHGVPREFLEAHWEHIYQVMGRDFRSGNCVRILVAPWTQVQATQVIPVTLRFEMSYERRTWILSANQIDSLIMASWVQRQKGQREYERQGTSLIERALMVTPRATQERRDLEPDPEPEEPLAAPKSIFHRDLDLD